jgi:hypothetical protein
MKIDKYGRRVALICDGALRIICLFTSSSERERFIRALREEKIVHFNVRLISVIVAVKEKGVIALSATQLPDNEKPEKILEVPCGKSGAVPQFKPLPRLSPLPFWAGVLNAD